MRPAVMTCARAVLLTGPVALAFFSGGFNDAPRLVALAGAWAVVAVLAVAASRPLPRRAEAWAAIGGVALLCGWMAVSRGWAPLDDASGDDVERVLLYLGALLAGVAVWRWRPAARMVEPLVALGILVVVGYGLSGRLLPGIVVQHPSISAGGRLEQPLTYWNATGALAAIGVVLCARLAGDLDRPPWVRGAAAVSAVPLCAGVYLSFSRGALAALAGGLVVLIVLAPTWSQLRAAAICLEAGALGAIATAAAPGVRALAGGIGSREAQGAAVLAALLAAMALAAGLARWATRAERQATVRLGRLPLPRWAGLAAVGLVVALVAVPVLAAHSADGPRFGATSQRLTSTGSNRYDYWKVALRTFADHPLEGVGSGGFATEWLRERHIHERVRDAHSLELETLAELGLVGGTLLALFLGGVALCARRVQRSDPVLAAGSAAALTTWLLHASLDWDWEMPALTLVAVTLAATLVARADELR